MQRFWHLYNKELKNYKIITSIMYYDCVNFGKLSVILFLSEEKISNLVVKLFIT
jgi:hypothetical protein